MDGINQGPFVLFSLIHYRAKFYKKKPQFFIIGRLQSTLAGVIIFVMPFTHSLAGEASPSSLLSDDPEKRLERNK